MWNFESANVKKYFGANLKKAKTNHDKELKKIRTSLLKPILLQSCQSLNFGSTSRKLVTLPARQTSFIKARVELNFMTLLVQLGNIAGT